MRGRRSSRSAAVVLAGCVGLAVVAPGMALAAPDPTIETQVECLAENGTWTPTTATTGTCDVPATTSSSTTTTTTTTSTPPALGGIAGTTDGGAASGGATGGTGTGATEGASGAGETSARTSGTPQVVSRQLVSQGSTELQDALDESTAGLVDNPVTNLVPIELPADLPFEVPSSVPEGGFTNPQEACGYFVSGLSAATPEQAAALGTAAAQFCSSLPTSFTDLDPEGLLQDLIDLLEGLIPSLPGHGGTGHISSTPPTAVPAYFAPYWYHQYDVDCPELTYEEAQAILAWDPSDPFRLDADDDGIACDRNARQQQVVYVGYPVGGVATGDGSTGGASDPAVVVLAAGLLSGLGLAGLTLVRRFAREG